MRTAHLVVSGMAFAVWTAVSVVFFVTCEDTFTGRWWIYGSAAVMPAFWSLYAWFAARRADPTTYRRLTHLAVPVLVTGLYSLLLAVADAAKPPGERSSEYIIAVMGGCCWPFSVPFGLISFIWAILLHGKSLRQPPTES